MARVILDSDDEDALDQPLHDAVANGTSLSDSISSLPEPEMLSETRSTCSTAKLRSDIEQAQLELIHSSPRTSSRKPAVTIDIPVKEGQQTPLDCTPSRRSSRISQPVDNGGSVAKRASKSTPNTRKRRRGGEAIMDEITKSDEIAIGLPKENYKPRASRSRSIRLDIERTASPEPPDVKPKRKKTHRKGSEAVEELVAMGFSGSQVDLALKSIDGRIEAALDRLLGDAGDAGKARDKVRSRGDDGQKDPEASRQTEEAGSSDGEQNRNISEGSIAVVEDSTSVESTKSGPKRGRGRPRKASASVDDENSFNTMEETKTTEVETHVADCDEILEITDPNPKSLLAQNSASSTDVQDPEPLPSQTAIESEPHDAPTGGNRVAKDGDEHPRRSAIKIPKTTYRVGLSKNSRIPSLLRTTGR